MPKRGHNRTGLSTSSGLFQKIAEQPKQGARRASNPATTTPDGSLPCPNNIKNQQRQRRNTTITRAVQPRHRFAKTRYFALLVSASLRNDKAPNPVLSTPSAAHPLTVHKNRHTRTRMLRTTAANAESWKIRTRARAQASRGTQISIPPQSSLPATICVHWQLKNRPLIRKNTDSRAL